MKRKPCALLLALFLLTVSVSAETAGSADNPLISQSYISDTFLPQVKQSLAQITADAAPAETVLSLSAGESVALTEGQSFTLLSGTARLSADAGEVINVTTGSVAKNGSAAAYSRYIVCGDSHAYLDATSEQVLIKVSAAAELGEGCPFADVGRESWYFTSVFSAYQQGLIDGVSATMYAPTGSLTVAQCIKLAACLHQLWNDGAVTLEGSISGNWYDSYVSYALKNGILDAVPEDCDSMIDRTGFVAIFYRALPERAYTKLNQIADGAIPDVNPDDANAAEIYAFYRAGILTGYTGDAAYAEHAFGGSSQISRAEVAAILNRMTDETARVAFTLG